MSRIFTNSHSRYELSIEYGEQFKCQTRLGWQSSCPERLVVCLDHRDAFRHGARSLYQMSDFLGRPNSGWLEKRNALDERRVGTQQASVCARLDVVVLQMVAPGRSQTAELLRRAISDPLRPARRYWNEVRESKLRNRGSYCAILLHACLERHECMALPGVIGAFLLDTVDNC